MTSTERRELEAAHDQLRALIHSGDPQRYHEINEAFHGVIYAGAHNEHLAELTLATRVRVSPYRRAQFRNLGRLAKSHVEHDRVVMAILRGDRDGAAAAMRAHIRIVSDEYWEYAEGGLVLRDETRASRRSLKYRARRSRRRTRRESPSRSARQPASSVPIESGGGIAATKRPKPSAGSAQISSAIDAPSFATRSMPGRAGGLPLSANSR